MKVILESKYPPLIPVIRDTVSWQNYFHSVGWHDLHTWAHLTLMKATSKSTDRSCSWWFSFRYCAKYFPKRFIKYPSHTSTCVDSTQVSAPLVGISLNLPSKLLCFKWFVNPIIIKVKETVHHMVLFISLMIIIESKLLKLWKLYSPMMSTSGKYRPFPQYM